MAKKEFKFLEAYRTAAPAASREVLEARQKAHDKLYPQIKSMEKIYELCRISFGLPFDSDAVAEWFEKSIKGEDNLFSLTIDKAEASLLATLVLRDCIWRGGIQCSLACLVASYSGRRVPGDGGAALSEARTAIDVAGVGRRVVLANKSIEMPKAQDLKAHFEAMQNEFQALKVRAAIEAAVTDVRTGATKVATTAQDAFSNLNGDARRLAEEVDMLWWHIGDWSELLECPRSGLGQAEVALVSAIELGDLVRSIPGPHGSYGLLRRALGVSGEARTSLKESLESIETTRLVRLVKPLPEKARTLFPVQASINLAAERGTKDWTGPIVELLGDIPTAEISQFELAIQAFRERTLIGFGGLE